MATRLQISQAERLRILQERINQYDIRFPIAELNSKLGADMGNISSMLKGKKPISDNFFTSFCEIYPEKNEKAGTTKAQVLSRVNEDPVEYNRVLPLGDLKITLGDYIELLKDRVKEAKERERELMTLLKGDIAKLKTNSETILDDLDQVGRMVRADDLEIMEGTDKVLGREPGETATRAGIVEHALEDRDEDNDMNESDGIVDSSGKEKRQET